MDDLPPFEEIDASYIRCHQKVFSCVYFLSDSVVAKFGPQVHYGEVVNLLFLREIGLPVPRVYAHFEEPTTKHYCILMERIRGRRMDEFLHDKKLTCNDLRHLLRCTTRDLAGFLKRIRAFKYDGIGSLPTTKRRHDEEHRLDEVHDEFFRLCSVSNGPFETEYDFLAGVAECVAARGSWTNDEPNAEEGILSLASRRREPQMRDTVGVFSKGRLEPEDVILDHQGRVVGIVGWSQAGYFPPYWEYVKAAYWTRGFDGLCGMVLREALREHRKEYVAIGPAMKVIW